MADTPSQKPCEYCGASLPLGVDKRTRRTRSAHFASCKSRPVHAKPGELKPCPFCGSTDIANVSAGRAGPSNVWHAGDPIFAVNCRGCGASVPNAYRNDVVVNAWNRRAGEL